MPWTEPETWRPPRPWIPVTLADRVRMKWPGSVLMFGHWMPIESIWTGRKLGHWNELPVAEPTLRKTPKLLPAREAAVAR